jgi:hypothetical protein
MAEERDSVWRFIEKAKTESDPQKLRAIVGDVTRELFEVTETLRTIERAIERQEAQDEASDEALKAAKRARQRVAIKAIRALTKLLPSAIQQARDKKNPRPALLRLILRATK